VEQDINVVLVASPDGGDENARIEMKVANKGRGPALACALRVEGGASAYQCSFGDRFIGTLAVDEERALTLFGSAPRKSKDVRLHTFEETVVVTYEDVAQNVYETRLVLTGAAPQYDKRLDALTTTLGIQQTAVRD
jgi:hypothetical protein